MVAGLHWGPHFMDAAQPSIKHWSVHFADGGFDPTVFSGFGPAGSDVFAMDLSNGFTVTYSWHTDITKTRSGKEQRRSRNDAARQSYRGDAMLLGNDPRRIRATLAAYAATGAPFLLGLPHEEMSLVADASGNTVIVSTGALSRCDWRNVGQRVAVVGRDGSVLQAVVQGTGSGTVILDKTPGATGAEGGRIMPLMAMYTEPQQDFGRWPGRAPGQTGFPERWALSARAAIVDFAPQLATLDMGVAHVSLAGNIMTNRLFGDAGNAVLFQLLTSPAYPATGGIDESTVNLLKIFAKSGTTTMADIATLLQNYSSYAKLTSYVPGYVIQSTDAFSGAFSGGAIAGPVGNGASVTMYDSKPLWDRPIQVDDNAGDSTHAMTDLLDYGGLPVSVGTADFPDWGRHVLLRRPVLGEWQWFKLFVSTVRGRAKTFWLPSWRDDFTFVSKSTGTIKVSGTDGSNINRWWPFQRDRLQIRESNGTITYVRISNVVDNGDGTYTFSIVDAANAPVTLATSSVDLISWLERCRFESDDFEVTFRGPNFTTQTVARVVPA